MKRKIRGIAGVWMGILLAMCLFCMAGCGQGKIEEEESNTGIAEREEKADFDLAAEQWTEPGAVEDSGETWTLVEYKEDFNQKTPDKDMMRASDRSASDGYDYYTLEYYLKWNQAGGVSGTDRRPGGRPCRYSRHGCAGRKGMPACEAEGQRERRIVSLLRYPAG